MKRFAGRTIIVVGLYSGIGQVVAQRVAQEGGIVVGLGRDRIRLDQALNQLPGEGHRMLVGDASNWDDLKPLMPWGRELGGYAGLVIAAGMHEISPLGIISLETLQKHYQDNVCTALLSTRALAKVARKDGSSVVWLSSVAALKGTAAFSAYAAAKGALISAARSVAVELASRRVRINVAACGVVETAMSQGWIKRLSQEQREAMAKEHLLGLGKPEHVADVVAFLLSDDSRWMTGSLIVVDGGLSCH